MKIAKKINTILCDDLRVETGNKFSIMGVFGGDLIINRVPAILAKLCLAVMLEGVNRKFSEFKVTVKRPGIEPMELIYPAAEDTKVGGNSNLLISLSPFQIEKTGKAQIEIVFFDEEKPSIIHEFEIKK